ncbi:UNKNOWN [Stylonychia lemnae]|uniref:Uncharacterized protein n=1 Tax=Stylonychia lemnae TaxID=5949 RepID=A0A078AML7_STYLE|nr:UNKNOWN [Stylonychia lemnae]|eukprot:CDW83645.1 UNKNOWN [Stylonychia lemnae]
MGAMCTNRQVPLRQRGPMTAQLKPFFDQDCYEQIDHIIENYKSELRVLRKNDDQKNQSKVLIVLFGSYCEMIKDIIFKSRLEDRKKLITELDNLQDQDYQVNLKILRSRYNKILREMFTDVSKSVTDMQVETSQILQLPSDRLVQMLDLSQFNDDETNELQFKIDTKLQSIKNNVKSPETPQRKRRRDIKVNASEEKSKGREYILNEQFEKKINDQSQLTEELCREILEYTEDIQREQIMCKGSPNRKEQDQFSNDDISSSFSTTDKEFNEEINQIAINGFEIEDRLFIRYGITYDQFRDALERFNIDTYDEEFDNQEHHDI